MFIKILRLAARTLFVLATLLFFSVANQAEASLNVSGFAWSESLGWVDFSKAEISDTAMSGYAYNDNTGWIILDGITNNNGVLEGYAWSESVGYFSFNNVTIVGGKLTGSAYNDNTGFLTFDNGVNVTTTWAPAVVSVPIPAPVAPPSNSGSKILSREEVIKIFGGISTPNEQNKVNSTNKDYIPQSCATYLNKYIKLGENNDTEEVKKLQTFLNTYEGEKLVIDGIYKQLDLEAVKRFQIKNRDIVLNFWSLTEPTGYVYLSTLKTINRVYCEKTKTFTCPYFNETTLNQGVISPDEISKIKTFLNLTQNENLSTSTSAMDSSLKTAISRFQDKHHDKVLKPWGLKKSTGIWYQSTRKYADEILGCYYPFRLSNGVLLP